ncbi:EG45-like domain containing protein [Rhodamnia argentea]|uniref:EG45-like domain containing protein n=1 Tax=Rhodamnia argentea TaxID=178133 RepID=A0A8B8MZD2_9MYRT|nr:EG45-like domain containing protein [Rhodamnia argentea]
MAPRATNLVLSLRAFLWFASILLFGASAQTPACYGFGDQGVMIAAASKAIWNGGAACGQSYQVECISARNLGVPKPCREGASVVVKIVDLCPANVCRGTIDLSREAFASIADPKFQTPEIST